MSDATFFKEPLEQSKVKARIVSGYFTIWAKIITNTLKREGDPSPIGYIDLYCGPGRYEDGTPSTPLLVLDEAIAEPDIASRLQAVFRDRNNAHVASLRKELGNLRDIDSLAFAPNAAKGETGDAIVQVLKRMELIPSLVFLDPCGYKGLSLELINSLTRDWACECIFFFNYNRINAGIANPSVADHMNGLFGQSRADHLRTLLRDRNPYEREAIILRELVAALTEAHGRLVLPFRFLRPSGSRTSHYLIFVTKKFKGYDRMKNIMASASSIAPQGVPTFEYNPSALGQFQFQFDKPLDALRTALLRDFAGHTMRMREIYEKHSVGTDYVERNYKDVLLALEAEGIIKTESHKKGTFAGHVLVRFPRAETG